MKCISLRGQVGADGVLRLQVPTEFSDAELDVVVIIQPLREQAHFGDLERASWEDFVNQTAGSIPDCDEKYDEEDIAV
jgi:hypothetical protein